MKKSLSYIKDTLVEKGIIKKYEIITLGIEKVLSEENKSDFEILQYIMEVKEYLIDSGLHKINPVWINWIDIYINTGIVSENLISKN